MTEECRTCGGTGRVIYHGDGWETDCPDCDGHGEVDTEADEVGAIREPDSLGGKAA